jgi:hypothetical protein
MAHFFFTLLMALTGSIVVSIVLARLFLRELWTPSLAAREAGNFRSEQDKLRLGEALLSREILHPFLGYVLNPAADPPTWKACGRERPPINSFGLIDERDDLPRRSDDHLVIAVFGGSVARYLAFDYRCAIIAALESSGVFAGKTIDIRCFAIGGFKQPQQLCEMVYFQSLGAQFDVVINLDGFNEVALHPAENAFKGTCHTFPRAWASRTATRVDPALVFLFGQLAFIQERRAWIWKTLERFPWNIFPPAYLVLGWIEQRWRSRKQRVIKSIRQFKPPVEGNLNTAIRREKVDYQQLVDLWAQSSTLMHELCQASGAQYLQFLQPNQYVPNSKPLSEEEKARAFDPDHPYRPGVLAGYPLLRETGKALREKGVAFNDLTLLFSECSESVYRDRCCHFNRRGNEIIAGAIAAEIVRVCAGNTSAAEV